MSKKHIDSVTATRICKGIIKNTDDSKLLQTVKVDMYAIGDEIESLEDVVRISEYGFSSRPPEGDIDAVILSLSKDRRNSVVIGTEDRKSRKKGLAKGEVAIYDHKGQSLHLKEGHTIEINATQSVKIMAGTVSINVQNGTVSIEGAMNTKISGNLIVDGLISSSQDIVVGDKSLSNHIHLFRGRETSQPI